MWGHDSGKISTPDLSVRPTFHWKGIWTNPLDSAQTQLRWLSVGQCRHHTPWQKGAEGFVMRETTTVHWHITIKFRLSTWHSGSRILNCWVQSHVASRQIWSSTVYQQSYFFPLVPSLPWCYLTSWSKTPADKKSVKISCVFSIFQKPEWADLEVPKPGRSYKCVSHVSMPGQCHNQSIASALLPLEAHARHFHTCKTPNSSVWANLILLVIIWQSPEQYHMINYQVGTGPEIESVKTQSWLERAAGVIQGCDHITRASWKGNCNDFSSENYNGSFSRMFYIILQPGFLPGHGNVYAWTQYIPGGVSSWLSPKLFSKPSPLN